MGGGRTSISGKKFARDTRGNCLSRQYRYGQNVDENAKGTRTVSRSPTGVDENEHMCDIGQKYARLLRMNTPLISARKDRSAATILTASNALRPYKRARAMHTSQNKKHYNGCRIIEHGRLRKLMKSWTTRWAVRAHLRCQSRVGKRRQPIVNAYVALVERVVCQKGPQWGHFVSYLATIV